MPWNNTEKPSASLKPRREIKNFELIISIVEILVTVNGINCEKSTGFQCLT